jgi:predicted CXXCH cytochrome family protein
VALGLCAAALAAWGTLAQDKPTGPTNICANETCHVGIVRRKVMHRPAARLDCLHCHEYAVPEQHLFRMTTTKGELCEGCHTLEYGATVHEPVAQKNCTGCHDPHGSDHRMLLVEDPARGLCATCHNETYGDREFVHGPVAVGACVVCHASHSSSHEKLLTMAQKKLCVDCHAEIVPKGVAARHLHKPMEEGCTTCHDPHASDVEYQLHDENPFLCLSCHEGMKNLLEAATVMHGPVGDADGCVQCHDAHFTSLPALQKSAQPDLCLNCHNRPLETAEGRTLADMAALLRENPNHHGPIREGACTTCHEPHGGERFGLLFLDYPAEFYAPYDIERYQLCFSCHLADLVEDESGTGLTRFRDGDRNLHWLHVHKEKGRTCRACHEVHASKRPFHIREAVPYGASGWMLEINFEQTADGGTCSPACHKFRSYGRNGVPGPVSQDAIPGDGD